MVGDGHPALWSYRHLVLPRAVFLHERIWIETCGAHRRNKRFGKAPLGPETGRRIGIAEWSLPVAELKFMLESAIEGEAGQPIEAFECGF